MPSIRAKMKRQKIASSGNQDKSNSQTVKIMFKEGCIDTLIVIAKIDFSIN